MDFGFIAKFSSFFRPNTLTPDDDFVDRLNHHVTVAILLLFMAMVSGKTYVGQPLQCAVPHQYNKAMEQYAENYCFVQNTYFIASGEEIPNSHSERDAREITYYQWVPFVLALQALMFYAPCLIWRSMNWKSGIHVASIARLAMQAQVVDMEERKGKVKAIVAHIYEGLHSQKDRSRSWTSRMKHEAAKYCCFIIGREHGNYLSMLYLFTKFLYVVNVFGQFFLMNSFLSSKWTNFYGFQIASEVCSGHEWSTTGQFPRVTYCDFEMRVLGNVQRYTIQCVLMINMFNEKIYIFFWWWCFFMAIASTVSFIMCIFQTFVMSQRANFVLQYLKMSKATKQLRRRDVEDFMNYHLQKDGVLLIRIISSGVGATVAFDVVEALWDGYQTKIHHASRTGSDVASSGHGSQSPPQYEPDQKRKLETD